MASHHVFGLLFGVTIFASVAGACSSKSGSGATCPPNSTLTYDSFGKSFFQTNCLRCHSHATKNQDPNFDTVDQIRANKSDIDEEAASGPKATNTDMPEDGDIALTDRQQLGEWLACGAP